MTAKNLYSLCVWLVVAILAIVAFFVMVGCQADLSCGESSRNLRIPYAYAAAYVMVTESAEKTTEKTPVNLKRLHFEKQPKKVVTPNSSAAAEGETTPAVTKGSAPPAAETKRPLFYEIILHTGKDCATCDRLKHELKVRGYPFTEHLVSKGTVPTAFIDGEEFVGDAIYNRLKIVKLNRKDSP